jgi:NADH dehydrogenase
VAKRPHVVVIGSGFGGLFATRALAREPVDITLIDRTPYHLFQPLLYQVATGILSAGEVAPPNRDILRRQRNVKVLLAEVEGIDLSARSVSTRSPVGHRTVGYDELIVAAGSVTSFFGHDEFAAYARPLKTLDDALELRGRIFGAFEVAEDEPDPEKRLPWMTFVVIGAGPTGVEMAGQLAELAHRALRDNFCMIDPAQAKIILVDRAPAPLGTFGRKLSHKAAGKLAGLGVELRLGSSVVAMSSDSVTLSDEHGHRGVVATRCIVWSAGVGTSPLAATLAEQTGATLTRRGQVPVQPDLTLPGHPEVHVIGDMAALDELPGVAQVAIQGGKYAAGQIARRARGEDLGPPFRYHDKGSLATISRFDAVAEVGRVRTDGFLAWSLWLAVHLLYMVGFKGRVSTLFHWMVSFVGRGRAERAARKPQWPVLAEPPK